MAKQLKQKVKDVSNIIFQKKVETKESFDNDIKIKTIVYAILALVSLILSILNIVNKYWLMTYTTGALFIVCLVCLILVHRFKNRLLPDILIMLAIMGIFSYYGVSGQNNGFAILWIVLVPAVGMLLLTFRLGLIVSIYFMLFLIVIFYTPVKNLIPANAEGVRAYTDTFMIRYPLLYLAAFLTSLVLTGQKVYYLNKAQNYSLYDNLTGLKNRRYFNELYNEIELGNNEVSLNTTIICLDMNNLKLINDKFGHFKGDDAIIEIANLLNKHFGRYTNKIYRIGGDEFTVVFDDKDNKVDELVEKFNAEVESTSYENYSLSISYGYVKKRDYIDSDLRYLISVAEKYMYHHKEEYYKSHKVQRYRGQFDDFD